jgi:enoyl-CoA hydratase/carnithine racemase
MKSLTETEEVGRDRDDVEYAILDGVATVTLARPDRRNAFTLAMIEVLADALVSAAHDPQVRVVLLQGAGEAFCSGVDLDDFSEHVGTPWADRTLLTERVHRVAYAIEKLDKPLIAAVDGVAIGAGMDMALMCDIRLATVRARFSQGYVKIGLIPGDGGSYLLPRIVGVAKALELMWTGQDVDGAEALRLGIVTHLFQSGDELTAGAQSLAARLAAGPPLALQMIKRLTYQSLHLDFLTSLDIAASNQAVIQSTADSREAFAAFREGREPTFRGS